MSRHALMTVLHAWLAFSLQGQIAAADPMQLTIELDAYAKQFLSANQQKIVIVVPDPESADGSTVVAAITLQPIADSTKLIFESDAVLYISNGPVEPLDTLNMAISNPVAYGYTYSFNGVQINGDGSGWSDHVGIYYAAPSNAQPVVTGLAEFIYESGNPKPDTALPINYYALNPFETQYIKRPAPVVWIFVASTIDTGSLLPSSTLKPVTTSLARARSLAKTSSQLQIGRYLAVTLDSSTQPIVHFSSAINAFIDGPYPSTE
ncbi:hypothetical protein J4P02_11155 [Pseudomonas sp. NFXW11]|uniref:hypothetical protein n=1 Tax=Pseudomonas sp. NFXW11 TaxID=2819531 RepID=UPI003CFA8889